MNEYLIDFAVRSCMLFTWTVLCFFSRENMSARHPQLELDSRVSVASVAPKGGDLPNSGPQRLLPTR